MKRKNITEFKTIYKIGDLIVTKEYIKTSNPLITVYLVLGFLPPCEVCFQVDDKKHCSNKLILQNMKTKEIIHGHICTAWLMNMDGRRDLSITAVEHHKANKE